MHISKREDINDFGIDSGFIRVVTEKRFIFIFFAYSFRLFISIYMRKM